MDEVRQTFVYMEQIILITKNGDVILQTTGWGAGGLGKGLGFINLWEAVKQVVKDQRTVWKLLRSCKKLNKKDQKMKFSC